MDKTIKKCLLRVEPKQAHKKIFCNESITPFFLNVKRVTGNFLESGADNFAGKKLWEVM